MRAPVAVCACGFVRPAVRPRARPLDRSSAGGRQAARPPGRPAARLLLCLTNICLSIAKGDAAAVMATRPVMIETWTAVTLAAEVVVASTEVVVALLKQPSASISSRGRGQRQRQYLPAAAATTAAAAASAAAAATATTACINGRSNGCSCGKTITNWLRPSLCPMQSPMPSLMGLGHPYPYAIPTPTFRPIQHPTPTFRPHPVAVTPTL